MIPSSVQREVTRLFDRHLQEEVIALLEGAEFSIPENEFERVCHAIIHYSKGDKILFAKMILESKFDWRDILYNDGLVGSNWREVLSRRGVIIASESDATGKAGEMNPRASP